MRTNNTICLLRQFALRTKFISLTAGLEHIQRQLSRNESRKIPKRVQDCFHVSTSIVAAARTAQLHRNFFTSSNLCVHEDTIFSLSSGHGKCGVAVIRISGPQSIEILRRIGKFKQKPIPRLAILRKLVDPSNGEVIDKGIILFFPKPNSFTGEDCVEFQVHGGPAVVSALIAALYKVPGCRQAEPGEYTKWAFLNGKLDLTEVEGLGDLIHAETEAQRRQALRQMDGELGTLYKKWTDVLIKCMADVEAFIDFSEDQDIEETVVSQVSERISELSMEIAAHLDDNRRGERLRQGVQVVIMGEPNVGKSSLLNALCQRSAAIVTPVAGTTRDVIETAINIGGFPVVLSDTAGLRHSDDVVESEGIRRALDRCHKADLKIFMLDSSAVDETFSKYLNFQSFIQTYIESLTNIMKTEDIPEKQKKHLESDKDMTHGVRTSTHNNTFLNHLKGYQNNGNSLDNQSHNMHVFNLENIILVFNKIDKLTEADLGKLNKNLHRLQNQKVCVCLLSCLTKAGFTEFSAVLRSMVENLCGDPLVGHPSLTQARHREHLSKCLLNLNRYREQIEDNDIVLAAQCLRRAVRHIGSITGKVTSEDILDIIFRDFCIGK